jgi:hypothetical protein
MMLYTTTLYFAPSIYNIVRDYKIKNFIANFDYSIFLKIIKIIKSNPQNFIEVVERLTESDTDFDTEM